MAGEYPKHSCGHDGERLQTYGKMDARRVRFAAMERQECPECRAKKVLESGTANGLPALVGSPKQISWAGEIRERKLRLATPEVAEKLWPEPSAKWWIDNR